MYRLMVAALCGAAWCVTLARADEAPKPAAQSITVEEAVSRALAASPAVKARHVRVNGSDAAVRQSDTLPNPEIDVELENFAGSGRLRDFDESELTLGVSQRIERGGKRTSRVAVAAAERDTALVARTRTRLDTALAARRTFFDVCAAELILAERRKGLETATQIEALAARRVAAARDPITVKLRAEIQATIARGEFERAQVAATVAKKKLAGLWGTSGTAYEVDKSSLLEIPDNDPVVDASASPDLQSAEVAVLRADAQSRSEIANAHADVSVGIGVRSFQADNEVAGVLSLSMPLSVWDTNQGNIERSVAERRAAELEVAEARRTAEQDIISLQADARNARAEAISLRKDLLPRAESALTAARRGYELGAFSYLEISESLRTLSELRLREVEVLRELHAARAMLEKYAVNQARGTEQ
jgi:cobalt-zinc-cadmium efflux system outer membrane protein